MNHGVFGWFLLALAGRGGLGRWRFVLAVLWLAAARFSLERLMDDYHWFEPGQFKAGLLGWYPWELVHLQPGQGAGLAAGALLSALAFGYAGFMICAARLRQLRMNRCWGLLFLVPAVKIVFAGILFTLRGPGEAAAYNQLPAAPWYHRWVPRGRFGAAAGAAALCALAGVPLIWLATMVFGNYGWTLFAALPFTLGFTAVLVYNFHERHDRASNCRIALAAVVLAGLALLAAAMEGIICLAMAAPIALLLALAGGLVADALVARRPRQGAAPILCAMMMAVPASMTLEHQDSRATPLIEVKTVIEIDAPPRLVWPHVVSFEEMPPPAEWLFRAGIAYPVSATIQGRGAGASRTCVLSTGPMPETVEIWDEPRLLRFKVLHTPVSMHELSRAHAVGKEVVAPQIPPICEA